MTLTTERIDELIAQYERGRYIWQQYEDATRNYDDTITALRAYRETLTANAILAARAASTTGEAPR